MNTHRIEPADIEFEERSTLLILEIVFLGKLPGVFAESLATFRLAVNVPNQFLKGIQTHRHIILGEPS